jgi:hypothetical protein
MGIRVSDFTHDPAGVIFQALGLVLLDVRGRNVNGFVNVNDYIEHFNTMLIVIDPQRIFFLVIDIFELDKIQTPSIIGVNVLALKRVDVIT